MDTTALPLREQLVAASDAYCAATRRRRGTLSTILLKRGSQLDRVAKGEATLTIDRFESAMAWLSENWPEDAVWPDGVPRPERVDGATNSHDGETTARIGARPVNPARIAQPPMEA